MLKRISLAAALIVAMSCPANAGYVTVEEVLKYCTNDNYTDKGMCLGYLTGIADTLDFVRTEVNKTEKCIPFGVTIGTLKNIYLEYAKGKPETYKYGAVVFVIDSFSEAFCSNK